MASERERYPNYRPGPISTVPNLDTQRYDRLPDEALPFEHVPRERDDFLTLDGTTSLWWLLKFSAQAFLFTQAARLLGGYFIHPFLIPIWLAWGLLWALLDYMKTKQANVALLIVGVLPLGFTAILAARGAVGAFPLRLLVVCSALLLTAVFVNALGNHSVSMRLHAGGVSREWRERWLSCWSRRFDADELRKEAAQVRASGTLNARASNLEVAYLEDLADYPANLVAILGLGALALLPNALPLLVAVPPVAAAFSLYRRPLSVPGAVVTLAVSRAVQSWFRYGEQNEIAPGLWRSPSGSRAYRIILAGAVICLLSLALSPETEYLRELAHTFRNGDAASLWRLLLGTIASLLLPLLALGSVCVLALGRILVDVERSVPRVRR